MSNSDKPWLSAWAYLGFQLNIWLEDGNHGVTFDDVRNGIRNGNLWAVINAKIPKMDLGMFTMESKSHQGQKLIAALKELDESFEGRERRKLGIEKGGLSLLVAYVIEGMQQKRWTDGD